MAAPKKLLAEFVGTFFLVFTVLCHTLNGATNTTFVALSIASVLMITVYALGPVSGANFNPAVSLAISLAGKMSWADCINYILVQLGGSIFACFMACLLFGNGKVELGPSFEALPMLSVFLVEMLYTFMLCFVVLSVACVEKKNQYFGLAIGFVIVAGGNAGGWVSGGSFNPAVALGLNGAAFLYNHSFGWFIFYWMAELLGGCLAAGIFAFLRPGEFEGESKGKAPDEVDLFRKCVAEIVGTFFLVLTVGLNVLAPVSDSNPDALFSIASSLMCMIYAVGPISGAHLNPAVTVAVGIRKGSQDFPASTSIAYVFSQLLGGLLAGVTYFLISLFKSFPLGHADGYEVVKWPLSGSWFGVGIAEMTFTFLLCYIVLCTATSELASPDMFGLAIGFSVVAGGYAIAPISGASLNPAVSVAIDLTHLYGLAIESNEFHWRFWTCAVYSVFEIMGGVLAASVFAVTHPTESYQEIEEGEAKSV